MERLAAPGALVHYIRLLDLTLAKCAEVGHLGGLVDQVYRR